MAAEVDADELRNAVERLHGCPAQLVKAVPVAEAFEARPAWYGVVHIFDLGGRIDRPTDTTHGRPASREATGAASLPCSTRRQSPRLLMQFARRSSRSPRLIGMALKPAGCHISTALDPHKV
jgi:hypothetical protein